MRRREAGARIARDRPDLQGASRVEAVEVLHGQQAPEGGRHPGRRAAPVGAATAGGVVGRAQPAMRNIWAKAAAFVAVTQLVAVIVSVVACFTAVDPWKGLRRRLVAWPAAIHPVGLGVAAAVVAALAAAGVADLLSERAERAERAE